MKKRGISLIVLVITIIVILVLVTAVILTLTNNNAVKNENEIDVMRKEIIPDDWIDISESTPENGISLLIGKPELEETTIKFRATTTSGTYSVDWGDGIGYIEIESGTEVEHVYSTNSETLSEDGYLFEVKVTPESGKITKFEHIKSNSDSPLLWCQIGCDTLTDCDYMLYNATNLKKFGTATDTSLSKVKNMFGMFKGCSSLTSIPLLDTRKVKDMFGMFEGCSSLTSIPLLDTGNVTDMSYMFSGCSNLTSVPELNTRKVKDMNCMFSRCSSLTTIPKLDTSKVTDIFGMFEGCSSLTEIPLLDTRKVTDMSGMFDGCSSLTSIPELNTSKVTDMSIMFYECSSLEEIPKLDTSQVTDMAAIFSECNNLKSINISNTNLISEQINDVFDELPESTNGAVIDITGNPGESSCTRTIATDKGWTVIP